MTPPNNPPTPALTTLTSFLANMSSAFLLSYAFVWLVIRLDSDNTPSTSIALDPTIVFGTKELGPVLHLAHTPASGVFGRRLSPRRRHRLERSQSPCADHVGWKVRHAVALPAHWYGYLMIRHGVEKSQVCLFRGTHALSGVNLWSRNTRQ
jgi:hypothetical protein